MSDTALEREKKQIEEYSMPLLFQASEDQEYDLFLWQKSGDIDGEW